MTDDPNVAKSITNEHRMAELAGLSSYDTCVHCDGTGERRTVHDDVIVFYDDERVDRVIYVYKCSWCDGRGIMRKAA